jgi:Na+(H+)/acetate symporter ActP
MTQLRTINIGILVGWTFALAASTFCPLFVFGSWWPRPTATGAATVRRRDSGSKSSSERGPS